MTPEVESLGWVTLGAWIFTILVGTLCFFTGGGATVWIGGGLASLMFTILFVVAVVVIEQ